MSLDRIRSLDCWAGPISLEPLAGGITNRNYVVRDARQSFVVRVCAELRYLGIDRTNERICQQAAFRAGVSPEVVYSEDGLLVSRHVVAKTLSPHEVCEPRLIARLAQSLRRLHDARDNLVGEMLYFCPIQTVRTYTANARQFGAALPDDIDVLIADVHQLSRELAAFRPTLCHNDLLAANVLDDGHRLWLVDWEYAGIGNPVFDLASVSANCRFTDDMERRLVDAYFEASSQHVIVEHVLFELRILKAVSLLREALWATIQTVKSNLEFDFAQYARENFEAYRATRRRL